MFTFAADWMGNVEGAVCHVPCVLDSAAIVALEVLLLSKNIDLFSFVLSSVLLACSLLPAFLHTAPKLSAHIHARTCTCTCTCTRTRKSTRTRLTKQNVPFRFFFTFGLPIHVSNLQRDLHYFRNMLFHVVFFPAVLAVLFSNTVRIKRFIS